MATPANAQFMRAGLLVILLWLSASACSSGGTSKTAPCVSGATEPCACSDLASGTRTCTDGSFGTCACFGAAFDAVTTKPDAEATDTGASTTDVSGADLAPTCPGAPGCACAANADCNNALCIDTPAGKQCAVPCVTDCPAGFACASVTAGSGDIASICVPRWPHLCDPCHAAKDCESLGITGALCIPQGEGGAFCGTSCATDADCPGGYACSLASVGGKAAKQCQRKPGTGECPCSATAIQGGASTSCAAVVGGPTSGPCAGSRTCTAEGLSACVPPADPACSASPACVGKAEGATCDDGNPCTAGEVCKAGQCSGGQNQCQCQQNADCAGKDDADLCNGKLVCDPVGHVCALDPQSVVVCPAPADPCQASVCQPATGQCAAVAAKDGASCSDGDACTGGDSCVGGSCKPGSAPACDDGNPCTADSCDPKTGCTAKPVVGQQVACYDGAKGTAGVGTCAAGKKTCDDKGFGGVCSGQVLPAVKEACDGKDDNCNGQTDEGCGITGWEVALVPAGLGGPSGGWLVEATAGTTWLGSSADGKWTVAWSVRDWLKGDWLKGVWP
jgi:hypothetical protein